MWDFLLTGGYKTESHIEAFEHISSTQIFYVDYCTTGRFMVNSTNYKSTVPVPHTIISHILFYSMSIFACRSINPHLLYVVHILFNLCHCRSVGCCLPVWYDCTDSYATWKTWTTLNFTLLALPSLEKSLNLPKSMKIMEF